MTALPFGVAAQLDPPGLEHLVRGRVEAIRAGLDTRPEGDRVLASRALPAFYEGRAFAPAWVRSGRALPLLDGLVRAIDESIDHGLNPDDYHRGAISALRARGANRSLSDDDAVDLEILASDAYLLLASHLLHGRVNPETIDPEWIANRRGGSFESVLADAVRSGRVEASLFALAPAGPRYAAMMAAAASIRGVMAGGGWPEITAGVKLEMGVESDRVATLRARLVASGDLAEAAGDDRLFDEELAAAVRAFQSRHGLDVDGVAGPATFAAINVPAEARLRQLETNLERWRWLPSDLGERHIEVNIAGFDVKVVEGGETVRTHRAIVGRQYRQTPMFSGTMTYLVLAPYWHVPPTIAAVDKLPAIRLDPAIIERQRMTLLDQRTNAPVDAASVDWASITGPEFNRRYRLRQDPGPANALGDVKFMFPNRHNVYLHDTPSRELFGNTARSFSSGCIRVEDPLALAEYLLADQSGWDRSAIDRAVAGGVERTVPLRRSVPVHLLYWTAWAEPDGTVHFRDDIYSRDRVVLAALDASPPGA